MVWGKRRLLAALRYYIIWHGVGEGAPWDGFQLKGSHRARNNCLWFTQDWEVQTMTMIAMQGSHLKIIGRSLGAIYKGSADISATTRTRQRLALHGRSLVARENPKKKKKEEKKYNTGQLWSSYQLSRPATDFQLRIISIRYNSSAPQCNNYQWNTHIWFGINMMQLLYVQCQEQLDENTAAKSKKQ